MKKIISFALAILVILSLAVTSASALSKIGSRGEEVKKIQTALRDLGYFNSKIDGIYGTITKKAVERFQKDYGLKVDGIDLVGDWVVNDGVIPLSSSRFPSVDEAFAKSYEEVVAKKEEIEKGFWYYMEPIFKMDHFDFCGIEDFPTTMEDFYFELVDLVNSNN
jgi:peptidoglycan hydrolase-like protein with peptidoglycan-binding domain